MLEPERFALTGVGRRQNHRALRRPVRRWKVLPGLREDELNRKRGDPTGPGALREAIAGPGQSACAEVSLAVGPQVYAAPQGIVDGISVDDEEAQAQPRAKRRRECAPSAAAGAQHPHLYAAVPLALQGLPQESRCFLYRPGRKRLASLLELGEIDQALVEPQATEHPVADLRVAGERARLAGCALARRHQLIAEERGLGAPYAAAAVPIEAGGELLGHVGAGR